MGMAEENAVLEVLRSGWLARGARTAELEKLLADYTGAAQVLGLNSCTAALELALILIGVLLANVPDLRLPYWGHERYGMPSCYR